MSLSALNNSNILYNNQEIEIDKQFSQILFKAIADGNRETLDKLLSTEKLPATVLIEALTRAHDQNKTEIVAQILNHPSMTADSRNQVLSETSEMYDSNGDNLAILFANSISDPLLKQDALVNLENVLIEKSNREFKRNFEKQAATIKNALERAISSTNLLQQETQASSQVPSSLNSELEAIFKASEKLLSHDHSLPIEQHPLFKYFNLMNEKGSVVATFKSGPSIQDLTEIMLEKHGLELTKANRSGDINFKIFKNVETFFRCLDIFKKKYEEKTGKIIDYNLSYSLTRHSLDQFCEEYIKQFPELKNINAATRDRFIRLISIFNIDNDVLDLNITLNLSLKEKDPQLHRTFKPIPADADTFKREQSGSNEISLGQVNLEKQIQTLNGSELSMVHIKDADGAAQFKACSHLFNRKEINVVDLGGGYGETNAVMQAIQEAGPQINLLNIEPHKPCAKPYENAHREVGIENVKVMEQKAQLVTVADIINHFQNQKADCLFASHYFYGGLLADVYKASHSILPLQQNPLWKYLNMLKEDGVFIVTLQSGAGARLFRNALLGNHGLNPNVATVADESLSLLSCFGNVATFLRSFETFKELHQKATNSTLNIKMHLGVANVPLGGFKVEQDPETQGYMLLNPNGDQNDKTWIAPKMLDFYGNWFELEFLATLTLEKAKTIIAQGQANSAGDVKRKYEILKNKNLLNPTMEVLLAQRNSAREMQETFLHILRIFAPGEENMQHPNITLEITKAKS